jgi:heat shock protein HslJ
MLLFTIIVQSVLVLVVRCDSSSSSSMAATVSTHHYEGLYRLTHIVDTTVGEVPIPSDGTYTIQMRPSTTGLNQYDIGIKIGNSMGGSATITPSTTTNQDMEDAITIGGLRSTMMMPPPELYRIEVALSDLLPSATSIQIENDIVLTIKGSKGSVQATRQV